VLGGRMLVLSVASGVVRGVAGWCGVVVGVRLSVMQGGCLTLS
jgi:hypothetical protein